MRYFPVVRGNIHLRKGSLWHGAFKNFAHGTSLLWEYSRPLRAAYKSQNKQPAAARMIGGHGLFRLFITIKIQNYLLRLLHGLGAADNSRYFSADSGLGTADDPRYFSSGTGWALPITRVTSPRANRLCLLDVENVKQ